MLTVQSRILGCMEEVGLRVDAKDDSGQGLVVCGAQLSWSDARNEIVGFSRVLVSLSGPLWV